MSFAADRGVVFGLLGVNGSGKTTTFEMLAGIRTPSAGSIYIQGFDVQADLARARRFIGYCSGPQEDRIYPTLTVQEHLFLFGSIKGVRGKELADAVEALMERLLLSEYRHRFAGKLSRGNVRKLLVGIALIGQPPLIFLDEPSTGMDAHRQMFTRVRVLENDTFLCLQRRVVS